MKKFYVCVFVLLAMGCSRGTNDPAEQALVRLNRALMAEHSVGFLEEISPNMRREVTARLGLSPASEMHVVSNRLALRPGVEAEKLIAFKPKLIPGRSSAVERWYRVQLGGAKLQIPVKKVGDRWLVALNESLLDG